MQTKQTEWGKDLQSINRDWEPLKASNQLEGKTTTITHKHSELGVRCSFGVGGSRGSPHEADLGGLGRFEHERVHHS